MRKARRSTWARNASSVAGFPVRRAGCPAPACPRPARRPRCSWRPLPVPSVASSWAPSEGLRVQRSRLAAVDRARRCGAGSRAAWQPRRSPRFPYDAASDESCWGGLMIDGFLALYIFMLAAFTGYEIIARVPVILHTPLMSGSNFVHGIVLVGAMIALGHAQTTVRDRHRIHRRAAGRRQCGRRLRGDRADAGDVQVQQARCAGKGRPSDELAADARQGVLFPRRGAVHPGPETHEFAAHGARRHRLGRRTACCWRCWPRSSCRTCTTGS